MNNIIFEWNNRKATENRKKHGVSFKEATSVFTDENARLILDPKHTDSEDRFVLLGPSIQLRILVVVHCYQEDDEVIRIISARKADRSERRQYSKFLRWRNHTIFRNRLRIRISKNRKNNLPFGLMKTRSTTSSLCRKIAGSHIKAWLTCTCGIARQGTKSSIWNGPPDSFLRTETWSSRPCLHQAEW